MPNYEYEDDIVQGLIAAIDALPNAHASLQGHGISIGSHAELDAVIDVQLAGEQIVLLVELKRDVFPRDVHGAIFQLRRGTHEMTSAGGEILPLLAAESLSPGARDILVNQGIGYFDLGGSLFLPTRARYILIDRPPPKRASKALGSIFEGQKARVLQAALEQHTGPLSVKELAEEAGVAPSTASTTLSELERRDWAATRGSGPNKIRRIVDPRGLLDSWGEYLIGKKPPKLHRYYVPVGDVAELGQRLDTICTHHETRYAVTGEVAAQIHTPYLSNISQLKCRIQPGRAQWAVLEELDAHPVSEGWNLGVIEVRGVADIQLGERVGQLQLAPPLQIYLDLLRGAGRSADMAEHFRHERLGI